MRSGQNKDNVKEMKVTKRQVFEDLLGEFINDEKELIWEFSLNIRAEGEALPKVKEKWIKRYEKAVEDKAKE